MNYTKGDWKAYNNGYSIPIYADTEEERDYEIATAHIYDGEQVANAHLISAAPDMYEALKDADETICDLCKRLNPQHATADYGKGCNWCEDREIRLKAIAKVEWRE